jgi:hypothetical protein
MQPKPKTFLWIGCTWQSLTRTWCWGFWTAWSASGTTKSQLVTSQTRVANKVFLQVGIDWALAAQPRNRAFCFRSQLDIRKFSDWSNIPGSGLPFDRDLNELRTGAGSNIHASRRDKLGLVVRFDAENPEDSGHIGIVNGLLVSVEKARHVAPAQARLTRDVRLFETVPFRKPVQSSAEIAHRICCLACPILWEFQPNAIPLLKFFEKEKNQSVIARGLSG